MQDKILTNNLSSLEYYLLEELSNKYFLHGGVYQ